jgi:hypothetical protein
MAKITDPDQLNQGVECTITPGVSGTIRLQVAGNLSTDGVTLQALYSFLKEEWKSDSNLIKYPFPMIAITEEQFELQNNWDFFDDTTRYLIRDGGWALKDLLGNNREMWCNITTLGNFVAPLADLAYFTQESGDFVTPTVFQLTGPVNQAVKIYGDVTHGNFDYRTYFKIFLREEAKTYASYDLIDEQNLTQLTYKKYAMPLANASDAVKVTHSDAVIGAGGDYANIDITYYAVDQTRNINGTDYDFDIIIEGDSKVAEIIYEKIQYLLRQPTDIDEGAGQVRGDIADTLLSFVGDTLVTAWGVYIDNFAVADTNRIDFYDVTGTLIRYNYVATGTLSFNENLYNDNDAFFWMFFTSVPNGNYGDSDAIVVRDASSLPISGDVPGDGTYDFTFDYDANTQGGRTAGTTAPVTVVSIGLGTGQYVKTTYTLTRSKANNISIVAALERNYSNPA